MVGLLIVTISKCSVRTNENMFYIDDCYIKHFSEHYGIIAIEGIGQHMKKDSVILICELRTAKTAKKNIFLCQIDSNYRVDKNAHFRIKKLSFVLVYVAKASEFNSKLGTSTYIVRIDDNNLPSNNIFYAEEVRH